MRLALTAVLWIGLQAAASAANWYVATNGTGGGTNWATATNSLQGAIVASAAGDTVWVSNGVYEVGGVTNFPTGSTLTNRVAIYKAITLRSLNDDPTNTIIKGAWDTLTTNGPAAGRCVYMTNGASLIGFTLTNGATLTTGTDDKNGGGVSCQSINTVISNCVITGNSAASVAGGVLYGTLYNCTLAGNRCNFYGGGVYAGTLYYCALRNNTTTNTSENYGGGGAAYGNLYNCTIVGNSSARLGGGARSSYLENCTLISNSAVTGGGGVDGNGGYDATLKNCTLTGNWALNGGGAGQANLYNCALVGNSAGFGGGAYVSTLYNCTIVGNSASGRSGGADQGALYNCISWGNNLVDSWGTYNYSCGVGYTNGGSVSGNITNDPLFITNGSGYGTNHVAGNYRLRNVSPPLNAGTNYSWMTDPADVRSKDLDNQRRIDNFSRQVDMGCYELMLSGTMFKMK